MGAFNRVLIPMFCCECKSTTVTAVQFKYGDTWQCEYNIGDRIRWGGNDVGTPGLHHVVVDGVLEACPNCHNEHLPGDYYVFIVDNKIVDVVESTGEYDFASAKTNYLIIRR